MSREQKPAGHHNYSYIDVLERVADGVHVDVISRKSDEESRERNRSVGKSRKDDSPKPSSSKR